MIRKIITFTICIVITLLALIYTPHIINAKNIDNIRAAETTGESIDIKENVPGDINGDGKVNNKDFTRLFQYMAGWKVIKKENNNI